MVFALAGYALKRVIRSWRLFIALTLGVILASSFFAGINISINSVGAKSLNQQLTQIYADMVVSSSKVVSSQDVSELRSLLSTVDGVVSTSVLSRISSVPVVAPLKVRLPGNTTLRFRLRGDVVLGVSEDSYIYRSMVIENGNLTLGEDEVYIEVDSDIAPSLSIGDNITLIIQVASGPFKRQIITKNLTVAGFISLNDQAFLMAFERYGIPVFSPLAAFGIRRFAHNIIITEWNRTFSKILDEVYSYSPSAHGLRVDVILSLDRESLVNAWDVESSKANLEALEAQLKNLIEVSLPGRGFFMKNQLLNVINSYESLSVLMILQGVILALPVFFVAWYMGLTVSNVSFNLRRREIGLLSTKGFSSGQLLRLFLLEAAFVGVISAAAGIFLGAAFTPIFTMGQFTEIPNVGLETVVSVIVFSIAIALLAVYKPARRAAKMKAVDALREYLYVEEAKTYRKVWLWLALALGTYKIVMLILGLDIASFIQPTGGVGARGFLMNILIRMVNFVDDILTYLGPILFFWGFAKIFIEGSVKVQELLGRVTRFFIKDLSIVAERNVRRNAARVASVTFLLAIIVGYSVSAVGQIATQRDYTERLIRSYVGADLSIIPSSVDNVTSIIDWLKENVTGIESITVEYTGFGGESPFPETLKIVAINPKEWFKTAYYEAEWFRESSPDQLVSSLSNDTIILDGKFSKYLDVGDQISITIGGKAFNLTVVAFYGPEELQVTGFSLRQRVRMIQSLNSYINLSLYECVNETVSATARILVNLEPGADGEGVAQEVRELDGVDWVVSVAEQMRLRDENVLISGPLNIMRLGVFFAALAASVGVALVTFVTLQERKKEITLLMVRGLSLKQVVLTLVSENLSVLLVAYGLGGFVGYLIDRGNVAAMNVASLLVAPRVIFPTEAVMTLTVIGSLLAAAAIIPIIIMVLLYSSRLVWRV